MKTINNLKQLEDFVDDMNPEDTVLFLDIDNTLLKPCTYIGSNKWINWQYQLIQNGDYDNKYLIAKTVKQFQYLYYEWQKKAKILMEPVDDNTLDIIQKYINLGYKIIFITSRNPDTRDITISQLRTYLNISTFNTIELFFYNNNIYYHNGFYFGTRCSKGDCMHLLLSYSELNGGYKPVNIVFVDDILHNCITVTDAISPEIYNVVVCHYYKDEDLQYDKAHEQWLSYLSSISN